VAVPTAADAASLRHADAAAAAKKCALPKNELLRASKSQLLANTNGRRGWRQPE